MERVSTVIRPASLLQCMAGMQWDRGGLHCMPSNLPHLLGPKVVLHLQGPVRVLGVPLACRGVGQTTHD